jgi:replicative DNA helicase
MIDYLQLVRDPSKKNGRYEEVTAVSGAMKGLAKALGIPVIALAQLSREVERRDNKRPTMSDLKESGAIEQDADQVVFIYRHEVYLEKEEPQRKPGEGKEKFDERKQVWNDALEACRNIAELIVEKNRHGRRGTAKARFNADAQRFENIIKEQSAEGPPEVDQGQWWVGQ